MPGRSWPAVAVAAGLLGGLATGCGGGDPAGDEAAVSTAPAGVTAEVLQYRRDEAERLVAVKVRNGTDAPVLVRSVELTADAVTGSEVVEVDVEVAPGGAVDLRVPYGDARCDADRSGGGEPAVRLGLDDREPVAVDAVSGGEVLVRVADRECGEQRVRDAVDLSWGPWEGGGGPDGAVDGVLRVAPRDDAAVTVLEVQGTTLFTVVEADLPVTAGPGAALDLAVRVVPARCDPHAVGESKRGYHFGVRVRLDDAPGGADGDEGALVPVVPDELGRSVLESVLLVHCGLD